METNKKPDPFIRLGVVAVSQALGINERYVLFLPCAELESLLDRYGTTLASYLNAPMSARASLAVWMVPDGTEHRFFAVRDQWPDSSDYKQYPPILGEAPGDVVQEGLTTVRGLRLTLDAWGMLHLSAHDDITHALFFMAPLGNARALLARMEEFARQRKDRSVRVALDLTVVVPASVPRARVQEHAEVFVRAVLNPVNSIVASAEISSVDIKVEEPT